MLMRYLWRFRKDSEVINEAFKAFLLPSKYTRPLRGRPGYFWMRFSGFVGLFCFGVSIGDLILQKWNFAAINFALGVWNMFIYMDFWLMLISMLVVELKYAEVKHDEEQVGPSV